MIGCTHEHHTKHLVWNQQGITAHAEWKEQLCNWHKHR